MKTDLFEFARQGRTASGRVAIVDLQRVETPDRSGSIAWSATGSRNGRHGALRVDLAIEGAVVVVCQRCLKPMTESLDLHPRFLVAADEPAAEALDQDDAFDVVVGSPVFDFDTLVEDEVILALPVAPRHTVCPDGAADGDAIARRPSPFAALAGLKLGRPGDASDGDEGEGDGGDR